MKNYLFTIIALVIALTSQSAMAALSATASVSPSTSTVNLPVAVSLAISNTGSSQLTVTNIQLTASATGASPGTSRIPAAFTVFNTGPNNVAITVGPNATTTIPAGMVVFFSPSTGITGSGSGTYSVGGTFYTSDGSTTPVGIAGIATVNPIPLPAYERL